MKRALLVAVAVALSACESAPPALSAGVLSPTSIVAFRGVTTRYEGLRTYVAVSSARNNDVRILDPLEDRPVLGPTIVFPLSIPTVPRPLRLAAASLGDQGADLLAVVSANVGAADPANPAGPRLQVPAVEVIGTWPTPDERGELRAQTRVVLAVPLDGAGPNAEVLSLAAGPVVAAPPAEGQPAAPAMARLVVGLATSAGPQIAVLDFSRAADGGVVPAAPAYLPVGFDPVDLAFSPDGTLLFAATPDPLASDPATGAQIHGVAQVAIPPGPAGAGPLTWAVTPLDARAPTRLVAAASVVERALDAAGADTFPDVAREPRVYAALDPAGPAGCGLTRAISCGVATLVPGQGLAPDPSRSLAGDALAGTMPYRAPIEVPGLPLALEVGPAPATASTVAGLSCGAPGAVARETLAPPTGRRCTTGSGIVTSSDGNTYVLDLGRFEIPNLVSATAPETRARVTAGAAQVPTDAAGVALPGGRLGLVRADGALATTGTAIPAAVTLTPGFTPADSFFLEWQGLLPELGRPSPLAPQRDQPRRGLVLADGAAFVLAGDDVQLASPELGVLPGPAGLGDIVEVTAADLPGCAGEATALAVRPASATLPRGGLELSEGCWTGALPAAGRAVTFKVRARGLVLVSNALGHLGRPALPAADAPPVRYALAYEQAVDEAGSLPGATHEQRVAQVLARKARRRFYPASASCATAGADCATGYPAGWSPLAAGPMIAFTPQTDPAGLAPARGAALAFDTVPGYSPWSRRPSGGTLPVGGAPVDRSTADNDLEIRWYVAYQDDQVLVFGPSESGAVAAVIR